MEDIFVRWQKSQWFKFLQAEQADRQKAAAEEMGNNATTPAGPGTIAKTIEEMEAEEDEELLKFFNKYDSLDKPSLGYRTIDQCPGPGDDTVHSPLPFNPNQPEYVASNPDPLPQSEDEVVDVVFVDFMRKLMIELLNRYDLQRNGTGFYTVDQLQRWGDITTQLLYPRFAELEWQPQDGAVKAVNAQARRAGKMGYAALDSEPDFDAEEQRQQQGKAAAGGNVAASLPVQNASAGNPQSASTSHV